MFRKSTDLGCSEAQVELGKMHKGRIGVEKNTSVQETANRRSADGRVQLGLHCRDVLGTAKSKLKCSRRREIKKESTVRYYWVYAINAEKV